MKISDLEHPVTASKADWLAASTWVGFTPTNGSGASKAQCQSTIQRQLAGGYIIEYITETAEKPNTGFEQDTRYIDEQAQHQANKGRLIALHRLRFSSRSLVKILGDEDFSRLQDMWAQGGKRWRWSVAFPVIETFEIIDRPKASAVFGETSYRRLFAHSSATLRPLNDVERDALSELEITRRPSFNVWDAISDEMPAVFQSEISATTEALIGKDLSGFALEGVTEERWVKIRKRAAWLADRFIRQRVVAQALICDLCKFDPSASLNVQIIKARSALDVHHKFPLEEGVRYTSTADFALLCPTCHRMEHLLLKRGGSFFERSKMPELHEVSTLR